MDYLKYTKRENGCLVWTRCVNSDGYPRARINGNSNGKVHREVFFQFNGFYPPVVRHTCDNLLCIYPGHLVGGNATDNMKDRTMRGRTYRHVSYVEAANVLDLRNLGYTYKHIAHLLNIKSKRVEYVCQTWRIRQFAAL